MPRVFATIASQPAAAKGLIQSEIDPVSSVYITLNIEGYVSPGFSANGAGAVDILALDQGSVWAQIAPVIESRHREILELAGKRSGEARLAEVTSAEKPHATRDSLQVDGGSASDPTSTNRKTVAELTAKSVGADGLTQDQRGVVRELAARDAEVRRHEMAHMIVGGQYASAPSYSFQVGPDGQHYAIAGEVQIDVSPVQNDPEATINKMEIVKAAALAPAEPSAADRQVASFADQMMARASAELMKMRVADQHEVDRRA